MGADCGSGAAAGYGIAGAAGGCNTDVDQPPYPGPGCTFTNSAKGLTIAGGASAGLGPLSVSGAGSYTDTSADKKATCNPTFNNTQINNNVSENSTKIDMGVHIMTKNTIDSLCENTNQMVVNSISNTTTTTSQDVNISQKMVININGCAGNLDLDGVSQDATVDLAQMATMTMSAVDDVRTDLATAVLQQFSASSSAKNDQAINADLTTALAAQQSASLSQSAKGSVSDTKITTMLPSVDPSPAQGQNLDANTNLTQTSNQRVSNAVDISAPYVSEVDFTKILKTVVNNSVTQNFTKNTVNILSQSVIGNQDMAINIANIGGNCVLKNISQKFNVTLRQTLTSKINIGTAIVNGITSALGTKTDDQVSNENVQKATSATKNDLRTDQTSSQFATSEFNASSFVGDFGGFGSSGSSSSSCIICIICVCSILLCGFGGLTMASGLLSDSSDSSDSSGSSGSSDSSDSSSSDNKNGGFSFF
jgi:hypothetical protein